MNNIYCDNCKHEFMPDLKERKRGVSVVETYFRCPSCKKHYTAFYLNQEGRRLQRVIRRLASELGDLKGTPEYYLKFQELTDAKHDLNDVMSELKEEYGS